MLQCDSGLVQQWPPRRQRAIVRHPNNYAAQELLFPRDICLATIFDLCLLEVRSGTRGYQYEQTSVVCVFGHRGWALFANPAAAAPAAAAGCVQVFWPVFSTVVVVLRGGMTSSALPPPPATHQQPPATLHIAILQYCTILKK
jgi:hypothetical protein